jgi:hypothetical protein
LALITNRLVKAFKLNILDFQGDLQPEEFLVWVLAVEEVLEFKGVPDEQQVFLEVRIFQGRVAAWWEQLKQTRVW